MHIRTCPRIGIAAINAWATKPKPVRRRFSSAALGNGKVYMSVIR